MSFGNRCAFNARRSFEPMKGSKLIKDFLLNFLHRDDPSLRGDFISFREVKGSQADILARAIYRGSKEAERRIRFEDFQVIFE